MILDQLSQCHRYASAMPGFAKAFEFLRTVDASCAPGRYELEGDRLYASVQRYTTKPVEQGALESHRKYTDIQFVVTGRETILWAPLAALTVVTQPYSVEKDIAFYGSVPGTTPVRLGAGQFAVFFPEDGHAPSLQWDGPEEVLKVVVKVRN